MMMSIVSVITILSKSKRKAEMAAYSYPISPGALDPEKP